MKICSFFLSIFFIIPLYMFGDLAGDYHVTGYSFQDGPYTASLALHEWDDGIFEATWYVPSAGEPIFTYYGHGIRKDDVITIAWELEDEDFGTQLYFIKKDKLKGPWITVDGEEFGTEKAFKID